jgi:hypothetical protein
LVLVPSGGKHTLESFETLYSKVLSKSIWGVEFFMMCDGDTRPSPSADEKRAQDEGRLRVLPRYHLENYFLDEDVWSQAFALLEPDGSWLRDAAQIKNAILEIAREQTSYAAALRASQRLRLAVGNVDAMPRNCHQRTSDELVQLMLDKTSLERDRATGELADDQVERVVREEFDRITALLDNDDPEWRRVVPGKPVLAAFAGRAQVKLGHGKTLYLAASEGRDQNPFDEVVQIFEHFATHI